MHRTLRFTLLGLLALALASCDIDRPVSVEIESAQLGESELLGTTLRLIPVCEGIWQVENRMSTDADFKWLHVISGTVGEASVGASETLYIRLPHVEDAFNLVTLKYGGFPVSIRRSNNAPCQFELSGSVYNDVNESGIRDESETGLGGLTMYLADEASAPVATFLTNAGGGYIFDSPRLTYGVQYSIAIPASTPQADNNEVIVPYYDPTSPAAVPHTFTIEYPFGLENVGDVASSFGAESLNFGFVLKPLELAAAFQRNALPRDEHDDHFWWDQMRRSLIGQGAQNSAVVKTDRLMELLQVIQFGSAEIDNFYAVPFRFTGNPIAAAESILKAPANRNNQQAIFESALLTVWLNRVHGTQINPVLLDGLLLAAEQAYIQQNNIVQPMGLFDSATSASTTNAVSSLNDFTLALNSTYRSGSGGIGSN